MLLLAGHAASAHNGRPAKCHPGLTCSAGPETSGADALADPPRRQRRRREPAKREPKESAGASSRFVLTLVILAWVLRSFVVAPFSIPSGSMLPTLYIGDYLFVAKWPYGYSRYSFPFGFPSFDGRMFGSLPERGDVVVFRHPSENADLIKRVIGLPGDTVEVRGGVLILNGQPVPREPLAAVRDADQRQQPVQGRAARDAVDRRQPSGQAYLRLSRLSRDAARRPSYTVLDQVDDGAPTISAAVTVPAGHVFLMGDNRDDSLDSRFAAAEGRHRHGPDRESHRPRRRSPSGRPTAARPTGKPWTWFTALRGSRIGNGYTGDAE